MKTASFTHSLSGRKILCALLLAIASIISPATAGIISTAPLLNDESQIVNTGGALVSAVNFGSDGNGNNTIDINGIVHQVSSSTNQGQLDLVAPALVNTFSTFDGQYRGNPFAVNAGYTGDMLDLMSGIAGNSTLDIDISGLTPGTDYLFQAYWEANNTNQVATMTFEGTDVQTGITGNGTQGVLISYEFTAGDNTLDVLFAKTAGGDNMWLQGYSLQVVPIPEPASLVLLSLGVAVCLIRRLHS